MDIRSDNGAHIGIGGDNAGHSITKSTNNYSEESWRLYAERLNTDFALLRQKCEQTERDLRGRTEGLQQEITNIQSQRVQDMRRIITAIVTVIILGIGVGVWALLQPATQQNSYQVESSYQALPEGVVEWLMALGEPAPLPNEYNYENTGQESEQHCIYEAINLDVVSSANEPVCFDTLSEAISELSKETGYSESALLMLVNNAKFHAESDGTYKGMSELSAVIGIWFSGSGYTGSSTAVYGGQNGCYDGTVWGAPVINQTINSAIKMGGCWTNTIHSEYYFNPSGASQSCNCSSVGLSRVRSARYSQ